MYSAVLSENISAQFFPARILCYRTMLPAMCVSNET